MPAKWSWHEVDVSIYTRTGDDGTTGLLGGDRRSKDDPRVRAYGEVDELNASLGVAVAVGNRAGSETQHLVQELKDIQKLLFELGAELATPPEHAAKKKGGLVPHDVKQLEETIDRLQSSLPPLKSFILPGGGDFSARLHMARAVCRRAERHCVALFRQGSDPQDFLPLKFLNRLADLLFVMARVANHRQNIPDHEWTARDKK